MEDVTMLFDTGPGNKQRLLNISEIAEGYTQQHCTALMALHAFSGCDTTSAFKGLGKVKPIKILLKMPKFVPILAMLGDSWDITDELAEGLDEFTCALYGRPPVKKVDDLRIMKVNELCSKEDCLIPSQNVDMGSLPPCKKSLVQHIKKVDYQVCIWKRAHIPNPEIPDVTVGHGWTVRDGSLNPLWYDGDVLPQELADIAEGTMEVSDDDDDSDIDIPLPEGNEHSDD